MVARLAELEENRAGLERRLCEVSEAKRRGEQEREELLLVLQVECLPFPSFILLLSCKPQNIATERLSLLQDSQLALERADSRGAAASRELETVRRDWEGRLEDREAEFRTTVVR